MEAKSLSYPAEILRRGAQHMEDRASTYDQVGGERSIPTAVNAFNAITGSSMSAEEGWMFMAILKMVRSQQGDFKEDNYEDGAAYFALMAEEGMRWRTDQDLELDNG